MSQNLVHVAERYRDTALGELRCLVCQMEKNGAAAALSACHYIVVEYDHTVIGTILAPQGFVACRKWQSYFAIVTRVARRIAPAHLWVDPASD